MRLAVISSLEHFRSPNGLVGAWPAAVREIDALASSVDEVVHAACLHSGAPPEQAAAHRSSNLRFEAMPPAGGRGLAGKLSAIAALPGRLAAIERAWRDANAALVRCPSNAAVPALLLFTLGRGPERKWVKYTGAWPGRRGEKLSYKLQRWWLRSGLTGAAVTIAGVEDAPGAVALCNPSLSRAEAHAAERSTRGKSLSKPWRLLCAGRLVPDKGVNVAIHTIAELLRRGLEAHLDIAGDGAQRESLAELARTLGVDRRVRFHGWLPETELARLYEASHALLAPSQGEGWSRAWTDAAARRCVPVVTSVGGARGLEKHGAGLVLRTRDPVQWAARLQALLEDDGAWRTLAERGPELACAFTYERFVERARALLSADASAPEPCEEGA